MGEAAQSQTNCKEHGLLDDNHIEYYSELESKIADIMTAYNQAGAAVKEAESRLSDLSLLIKHSTTYRQLKPVYEQYRKAGDKENICEGMKAKSSCLKPPQRS